MKNGPSLLEYAIILALAVLAVFGIGGLFFMLIWNHVIILTGVVAINFWQAAFASFVFSLIFGLVWSVAWYMRKGLSEVMVNK